MTEELGPDVAIVLDHPKDLVNVAGVLRVMMNFGLSSLRLVRPDAFDAYRIEGIAHRSGPLIEAATLHDDLDDALADRTYVVGTTARARTAGRSYVGPREVAASIARRPSEERVAIVFGREDRGLTNEALDRCHAVVIIPTDPEYSSLNLAQACLVLAYELYLAREAGEQEMPRGRRATRPPTQEELEETFAAIAEGLARIDFYKARKPEAVMRTLRTIVTRAAPDLRDGGAPRSSFDAGRGRAPRRTHGSRRREPVMSPADDQASPTPSDRYRALLEASRRLSATLGPDELYEAIHQETAAALEASGFYLALYDQSRDLARVVYYADDGAAQRVDHWFRASDSEVFRTRSASIIDDDLLNGSLLVLGEEGSRVARSAVTAPITLSGRLLGVVSAQSYVPSAYTAGDLELLQGIADVAAVALQNSIQFTELERRRLEAERLEEIGRALTSELDTGEILDRVVSAVQELLEIDGAAIWLSARPDSTVYRVAQSGGDIALPIGLAWDIAGPLREALADEGCIVLDNLEANPLVPEDVAEHITGGSAIGVPVLVGGKVGGVLTVGSRKARRFTRDDIGVLNRLANQFAVALGNARLHADLHALSLTDPLTGLPNRRRLQMHLDHEVAAARRGRTLGIAVLDIDRFKHYNDTFGHVAGDEILRAVGRLLSEENRAMNLVARFGGDEFVSVLSGATVEGLRHYVARVLKRVTSDPTLTKYDITVSCGVAEFDPESMATVNDILRAADADMYATKASNRSDEKAAG